MMYVIKLKYKKATEPSYANESIIHQVKDIRNKGDYQLKWFYMPLSKARRLMFELISRSNSSKEAYWFDNEERLEYISIVELSNYAPYTEYQVIDYKEFK